MPFLGQRSARPPSAGRVTANARHLPRRSSFRRPHPSSLLDFIVACIPRESPDWEDVAILRVADAARAVKDPGDPLLLPVAIRPLLRLEIFDALAHSFPVRRFRCHQRKQRPCSVHHPRALLAIPCHAALGIGLVIARGEVLAPTAIRVLRGEEKGTCLLQVWRGGRLASENQALDAEPGAVGEATSPRAVPRAISSLDGLDKPPTRRDRLLDLLCAVVGARLVEGVDGGEARHRALDVRVVDHDVAEDF
mmetsp:Transcript_79199/g.157472  ORF Transcript_79199/g.157472 Transcript_79199/m.157472 type:complete len:250 (-) Transcript_79199:2066-2815(-)